MENKIAVGLCRGRIPVIDVAVGLDKLELFELGVPQWGLAVKGNVGLVYVIQGLKLDRLPGDCP